MGLTRRKASIMSSFRYMTPASYYSLPLAVRGLNGGRLDATEAKQRSRKATRRRNCSWRRCQVGT